MADVSPYRDEAAALMGQYLLKGYKMLATHCQSCGTVLVQKKGEKETCVLCQEILPKVLDHDEKLPKARPDSDLTPCKPIIISTSNDDNDDADTRAGNDEADEASRKNKHRQLQHTRNVLFSQIVNATNQLDLDDAPSIMTRTQLCTLITTAVNSLKTLKDCDSAI